MITIDGSAGEGGGQVLRTALGLSLYTGQPFRIHGIRARRKRPGLMRQHLTCVEAATAVSDARTTGAGLGSISLTFTPGRVRGGSHRFAVGTAGSTGLVLQAVLPGLLRAEQPARLVLEGGTHNPWAPPFDFLRDTFAAALRAMGIDLDLELQRPGFHPAGGGRIVARVRPGVPRPPRWLERGPVSVRAEARVANLSPGIAERELRIVRRRLGNVPLGCRTVELQGVSGAGNVLVLSLHSEPLTETVTGFGEKHVPAGKVAEDACREARRFLAGDVPVGPHLADQLLVPMALAGGGVFRTVEPTLHARTNAEVIARFLPVETAMTEESDGRWRLESSEGRSGFAAGT